MANDYKYAMEIDRAREKALRYAKIEYNFYEQAKNEGYEEVHIGSAMNDLKCIIDILQEVGKKADRWIPTKLIKREEPTWCDDEYFIESDRAYARVYITIHGMVKEDSIVEEDGGYTFDTYSPEYVDAWMPVEIPEAYRKD